jgi:O-antigen/teichoic acid export membrane protein
MMGWLLVERAVRFGVAFAVGAAVARHLGVENFGNLSRALAFAGLFGFISGLGLDTILKRDLVAHPGNRSELLATAFWLRIAGGLLGLGVLGGASWVIMDNAAERLVTLVAGLPLLGSAFLVLDLDLQSQLRGRTIAVGQFSGTLAGALWRVVLIMLNAPLVWFAASLAIEIALTVIVLFASSPSGTLSGLVGGPRFALARRFLAEAWPLIAAGAAVGMYLRIDQVMLAQLRGPSDTGIYAAAVRLSELGNPVAIILASALLPGIVQAQESGRLEATARRAFALATIIALVLAILGTLAAPVAVPLCFGRAYEGSVPVFMVLVWSNVFVFAGVIRSQVLAARSSPRFLMMAACCGAIVNILLNLWWIPLAGPIGAAWATLVSFALAAWLSTLLWASVRDVGRWQTGGLVAPWRAFGKPDS